MILPDMPNLAEIAFFQHQLEEELERQARIIKARALDDGFYDEDLAAQTIKYLVGGDAADIEGINLMSIVLRTILRRIDIEGLTAVGANTEGASAATASATDPIQTFITWCNQVWDANAMDAKQGDVHRWAERDGESFVIVDYDRNAPRPWLAGDGGTGQLGLPIFYIHERYTSAEAIFGPEVGSNQGCKAHYRNDDPHQPLEMVSKRWIETTWVDGEPFTTQRMTLYIAKQPLTPARIEKYLMNEDGAWEPYTETTLDENGSQVQESWPIWWTGDGTETGESLPIPVVHFRNEELTPITKRLWGLQSGMDHAWSSLLGGVTLSGHQIFKFFGFYPTTDGKPVAADGSNVITVAPRSFVGHPDKGPGDASLETIEPADPRPILEAMDKIAIYCSFVAGLPINNFIISKAVASSATLRQGEADLVAHVNALFRLFGRGWGQVFEIARQLEALYGDQAFAYAEVRPVWAPVETVNVENINKTAAAQKAVGIPWPWIAQHVFGYDQEEVAQMEAMLAQAAAQAAAAQAATTQSPTTGDPAAPPGRTSE